MLCSTSAQKDQCLDILAQKLVERKAEIFAANQEDVRQAKAAGRSEAFLGKLMVSESSFSAMSEGLSVIRRHPDPVGQILDSRDLNCGAHLDKVSVPIGVIGVIYESRPNVTIDAAALCLKSSNAVILKGGSDALATNRVLASCLLEAVQESGLPDFAVQFIDSADRALVLDLLHQHAAVDLIIPRGGKELVEFVRSNSQIPVLSHAEGLDHLYIDRSADRSIISSVILNSKTQNPGVCNSLDTILIHRDIAAEVLPLLACDLWKVSVQLRCDEESYQILARSSDQELLHRSTDQDFDTEHLALIANVAVVGSVEEAVSFINQHGSQHTEAILATDESAITLFTQAVDAAAVMVNCSTRLHDGGVFGMGAEMGIATGKLHARGPVGLRELCSYRYVVRGQGILRT